MSQYVRNHCDDLLLNYYKLALLLINNASYYDQYWNILLLNIFVETDHFFQNSLIKFVFKKHLFEIDIFYNIINVFTVKMIFLMYHVVGKSIFYNPVI